MFQKLNVLDEHFDLKPNSVELFRGPADIAINQYPVVGGTPSSSNAQFSVALTPSAWLDPKAFIDYTFQYSFTLANASAGAYAVNSVIFNAQLDMSLTDYPFQTGGICGVCDIQLNTRQVNSIDMNKYGKILLELFRRKRDNKYAQGPSLEEDFYARLDDSYLTVSNSAGSIYDASNDRIPNGAWNNITVVSATNYTAPGGDVTTFTVDATKNILTVAGNPWPNGTTTIVTIQVVGREAIIMPPFFFGAHKEQAMFGISNLIMNFNFSQATIFRAFRAVTVSKASANPATLQLNTGSKFNLTSFELTLKSYQTPDMPGFEIPYPLYIKPSYTFLPTPVLAGQFAGAIGSQLTNVKMTNVLSPSMPRAIVIWADKNNENYGQNFMKYYYPLDRLVIGIGSRQNMLATFTKNDLFELSREAGLKRNFIAYSGQAKSISAAGVSSIVQLVGSPIILIPGVSFPLPDNITTNSDGSYTFTFTADMTSYNATDNAAINAYLNVMMVYDAWITINTNNLGVNVVTAPLSKQLDVGVESKPKLVSEEQVHGELETGGAMLHKPKMFGDHKQPMRQEHSKLFNRIRR